MKFVKGVFVIASLLFYSSCFSAQKKDNPVVLSPAPVVKGDTMEIYWPDNSLKGRGGYMKIVVDGSEKAVKQGDWTFYHEGTGGSAIQSRGRFNNDVMDGLWEFFSKSGAKEGETFYDNGIAVDVVKDYYSGGIIRSETPYSNGKIQGTRRVYYESGALQLETEFDNGQKNGIEKEYYENGKIKVYAEYKNDKLEGDWSHNYPNGQKMMEGKNSSGKKTGKWIMYHNNGKEYMIGPYVEGRMEGKWQVFSPEGWLESEGDYVNGTQKGLWIYYDKAGNIIRKLTLNDGRADGMAWLYQNGRLLGEGIMTGQAREPRKNGEWKMYYANGKLKYQGTFQMGRKNGRFIEYYSTGKMEGEGDYINGKRSGVWTFYKRNGKTVDEERTGTYTLGKLSKKQGPMSQ